MTDTVYVVTGTMRSGTSMMMQALQAGGLPIAYDPQRNWRLGLGAPYAYVRNPEGFFELDGPRWRTPTEMNLLRNKGVKILAVHASKLAAPTDDLVFRVVVMRRDAAEILASSVRAFGLKPFEGVDEYEERLGWLAGFFVMRTDVASIDVLSYSDVVSDPAANFQALVDSSWPIDVEAAAAIPTEEWRRHRLEGADHLVSPPERENERLR